MNVIIIYGLITAAVFIAFQAKIDKRIKSAMLYGRIGDQKAIDYLKDLRDLFIHANLRK